LLSIDVYVDKFRRLAEPKKRRAFGKKSPPPERVSGRDAEKEGMLMPNDRNPYTYRPYGLLFWNEFIIASSMCR
jgi:hypothetical protein